MDAVNISSSKQRRSPSITKNQDPQPQVKKTKMLNESELDSTMKHWEEYRVQGLKIPRRSYHSAASYNNNLYVYGGYDINAGILSDFLKVDLSQEKTSFEWKEVPVTSTIKPGPRCRHTTVVVKDKIYLFGGQINSVQNTNELFAYDLASNKWSKVEQNSLPMIDSHCVVLWEKGDGKITMIIVGGFLAGHGGGYSNAVYEYDFEENKTTVLFKNHEIDISEAEKKSIPPGRMSCGAAIYQNSLYIFGGNEGNTKLNDLWKFDLINKNWSFIKPESQIVPEPRNGHTLVCYKSILILFGGILDITHEKNDIFIFSLKKNSWMSIEKDTKWVFEDSIKQITVVHKKELSDSKKKGASPPRRRDNDSDGPSPRSVDTKAKSIFAEQGNESTSRSPRKFEKLKLLETLPKGVYTAKDSSIGDNEDLSSSKVKGITQFQSNLEEKATREKLLRKMILLKEFEVDEVMEKDDEFKMSTPALEAMQKSIESLGLNDKIKDRNENILANSFQGGDTFKGILPDDGKQIKIGSKPLARDGHSATISGDKMFIFAGDRHKMSFNDLFALNLKYFDSINI